MGIRAHCPAAASSDARFRLRLASHCVASPHTSEGAGSLGFWVKSLNKKSGPCVKNNRPAPAVLFRAATRDATSVKHLR